MTLKTTEWLYNDYTNRMNHLSNISTPEMLGMFLGFIF